MTHDHPHRSNSGAAARGHGGARAIAMCPGARALQPWHRRWQVSRATARNVPTRKRTLNIARRTSSMPENLDAAKASAAAAKNAVEATRPETQSEGDINPDLGGAAVLVEEVGAGEAENDVVVDLSSALYPEIFVTSCDVSAFETSVYDHPEAWSMANLAQLAVTRWINAAHSVDKKRNVLWLAWRSWHHMMQLYHMIEERRNARELTKMAKRLMQKVSASVRARLCVCVSGGCGGFMGRGIY